MMIRAVVFDIGGVLEITPDTGWQEKWEQRLHLTLKEIDERLASMGKDGSLGTCSEEAWNTKLLRQIHTGETKNCNGFAFRRPAIRSKVWRLS
jgi:hypothetical protein